VDGSSFISDISWSSFVSYIAISSNAAETTSGSTRIHAAADGAIEGNLEEVRAHSKKATFTERLQNKFWSAHLFLTKEAVARQLSRLVAIG
jgi:hypothetical protein